MRSLTVKGYLYTVLVHSCVSLQLVMGWDSVYCGVPSTGQCTTNHPYQPVNAEEAAPITLCSYPITCWDRAIRSTNFHRSLSDARMV